MWIHTNNAFVSIVEHRENPALLIVRGRFSGDVARFLGVKQSNERETPEADYRFRITTRREVVEAAIVRAVRGVKYPNFKDSIVARWRKALALSIWSVLRDEQEARARGFAGTAPVDLLAERAP